MPPFGGQFKALIGAFSSAAAALARLSSAAQPAPMRRTGRRGAVRRLAWRLGGRVASASASSAALRLGRDLRRRFAARPADCRRCSWPRRRPSRPRPCLPGWALDLLGRIERLQVEAGRRRSSCFFTSSSSDWRTISSTWPRNSDAMPRIWAIHLPQAAQQARQFLRADDDQRHDRDDQEFRTVDTEHRDQPTHRRAASDLGGAVLVDLAARRRRSVACAEIGLAESPGWPACAGGSPRAVAPTPFLKADRPLPKSPMS